MSFDVSVIAQVAPATFASLLAANVDAGRILLESERESMEGSFVERPLRVEAADVPAALRAVSLPADTKVLESRVDGPTIELLIAGRIDHRATIDQLLQAMEREDEDASFTVHRDAVRGELRVTAKLASAWAVNGWREPLLLVAMAAQTLGGEGRMAVFGSEDDDELLAELYRVEEGSLVFEPLDPPNDGFEATRGALAPYGIDVAE